VFREDELVDALGLVLGGRFAVESADGPDGRRFDFSMRRRT